MDKQFDNVKSLKNIVKTPLFVLVDGLSICNKKLNFNNLEVESVFNGRICFTGNRPNNLPWGNNEKCDLFNIFRKNLKELIIKLTERGFNYFYSGMAMGIDIIASEIVLELKDEGYNIFLECAIPCYNQTRGWAQVYLNRYNNILSRADRATYVSADDYYEGCYQKRNRYMVDSSDLVVAVNYKNMGGTKSTIDYAKKKNKDLILIASDFFN